MVCGSRQNVNKILCKLVLFFICEHVQLIQQNTYDVRTCSATLWLYCASFINESSANVRGLTLGWCGKATLNIVLFMSAELRTSASCVASAILELQT